MTTWHAFLSAVCPYVSLLYSRYSLYILSQILYYLNLWKPTELNVTDGVDATSYFLFCAHAHCACLAHKPDIARCIHSISDGSVFVCKASDHFWDSIYRLYSKLTYGQTGRQESMPGSHIYVSAHWPKSNQNFRDITRNVEENKILHEIFRIVYRFPFFILCYI